MNALITAGAFGAVSGSRSMLGPALVARAPFARHPWRESFRILPQVRWPLSEIAVADRSSVKLVTDSPR
jgi:uncharacterized lipoprotein